MLAVLTVTGCDVERRRSDTELGLNPQQAAGRQVYDNYCDRCHEPYSSRGKKGPSLMEGFGRVMTEQQVKDLLAYLHTL